MQAVALPGIILHMGGSNLGDACYSPEQVRTGLMMPLTPRRIWNCRFCASLIPTREMAACKGAQHAGLMEHVAC